MSLSDCIKCWETPCGCGWGMVGWGPKYLREQIDLLTTLEKGASLHKIKGSWDSVECMRCGLKPTYNEWTPEFFLQPCKVKDGKESN